MKRDEARRSIIELEHSDFCDPNPQESLRLFSRLNGRYNYLDDPLLKSLAYYRFSDGSYFVVNSDSGVGVKSHSEFCELLMSQPCEISHVEEIYDRSLERDCRSEDSGRSILSG